MLAETRAEDGVDAGIVGIEGDAGADDVEDDVFGHGEKGCAVRNPALQLLDFWNDMESLNECVPNCRRRVKPQW